MIVSSGITLRGTAAEFVQANPILKPGQIGYETDTGLFKTGNGKTAWNSFTKYSADQGPKGQKGDAGEPAPGYNLLNAITVLIDPTTEEEVSPIAKIPTSPYSKIKVYADVDEYAYSIGDTIKLKNVYDVEEVNPVLSASATSITALNSDVTSGLATFTLSEPISAYVNQYITLTDANESGWVLSPCQISTISGNEIEVYYNTSISPESSTLTSDWIVERDIFNSPLPAYYNSSRDVVGIISGAGSNSYTIDIMSTAASSLWESDTCNIGLSGLNGLYGPAGLTGDPGPKGDPGDPGADGADGADGVNGLNGIDGIDGLNGIDGIDGLNGADGQGVIAGGTAGQVLAKIDATDYNTQWVTQSGASITKRFIAIGPSDYFYISSNGYDWTTTPAPVLSPVDTWNAVHYANGIYVAAGGGNATSSKQVIYTSPDAITWTLRYTENTNIAGDGIKNIIYGNGIWIAHEPSGYRRLFYSTNNGVTWTNLSSPGGNHLKITYGNGNFLLVGYNMAKKSTNGSTWTDITLPVTSVTWFGCSYHNGLYFIFQENNSLYLTSPDLTTWTQRTHPQPFGNAKVGVSARGILVTATQYQNTMHGTADGINWKTFTMQLNFPGLVGNGGNALETNWRNGTYGDGKWLFGSTESNAIYMSENGQTWFNSVIPGMSIIRSTAYGEF